MRRALGRCLLGAPPTHHWLSAAAGAAGHTSGRAATALATTPQSQRGGAECCSQAISAACSASSSQQQQQQQLSKSNPARDRTWDASCSSQQTPGSSSPHSQQQQPTRMMHPPAGQLFPQQQHQQLLPPLPPPAGSAFTSSSTFSGSCRRAYSSRPATNASMPSELAALITHAATVKAERPPPPPLEPRPLTFESRRSGVIAVKAGMMQEWDELGVRVPLTVLWIDECMVLRHKHQERDGVTSLVLSCGSKRPKQMHPRQLGEFQAAGLPLKRKLWECRVSDDAVLPPGTLIGAAHFRAGQYLDISGTSKGKGFAGVMKRWNFAGQNATHGNTKHHRAPGSIGGRTDPGRVWKGKKMPGRLGGESVTFKNIWLYKVDPQRNLLFVRGQVPGPAGSFVMVRDAFRWRWTERQAAQLPFPTHIPLVGGAGAGELPQVEVAKRDRGDPYRIYREDVGYFEANWKGD